MYVEAWFAFAACAIIAALLLCYHAIFLPSSSMKSQVIPLSDLPTEVVNLICKSLDQSSMRAMRVTCKGLLKCMETCNTRLNTTWMDQSCSLESTGSGPQAIPALASAVHFTDLPLEMVNLIYKRLDQLSVRAMRVTCKGFLNCMDICNTRLNIPWMYQSCSLESADNNEAQTSPALEEAVGQTLPPPLKLGPMLDLIKRSTSLQEVSFFLTSPHTNLSLRTGISQSIPWQQITRVEFKSLGERLMGLFSADINIWLRAVTGLHHLDLNGAMVECALPLLLSNSASSLVSLRLGFNALDKIFNGVQCLDPVISKMTALQCLSLQYIKSTCLAPMSSCTALRYLNLFLAKYAQSAQPLSSLTRLQHLNLIACESIQDISPLSTLTDLRYLDARFCNHGALSMAFPMLLGSWPKLHTIGTSDGSMVRRRTVDALPQQFLTIIPISAPITTTCTFWEEFAS